MKKVILIGDKISNNIINEWIIDHNFFSKSKIRVIHKYDLNTTQRKNCVKLFSSISKKIKKNLFYIITFLDPYERFCFDRFFRNKKNKTINFFHPTSVSRAKIEGDGNLIGPWVKINSNNILKNNCIFLTNSTIEGENEELDCITIGRYSRMKKNKSSNSKLLINDYSEFNNYNQYKLKNYKNEKIKFSVQKFKNPIYW